MLGRKGDGLIPEKVERELKRLEIHILTESSLFQFDVKVKKMYHRTSLENNFKRIAEKYKSALDDEQLHLVLRYTRALSVEGYCREVLRETYHDSIKLQVIKVINEYQGVLKLFPPDILKAFLDNNPRPDSLIDEEGRIRSPLYIPTIEDIFAMSSYTESDISA